MTDICEFAIEVTRTHVAEGDWRDDPRWDVLHEFACELFEGSFVSSGTLHVAGEPDEVDLLRARVAHLETGIETIASDVEGWEPYNSRDTGEVYAATSVDFLVDDLRGLLSDQEHTEEPS